MSTETELIGIDWGTTHLRAYRIGPAGEIREWRESPLGIAAILNRDFATVLEALIGPWLPKTPNAPILMCGMIGSRQGWHEVPYTSCPATAQAIAASCLELDIGNKRTARIIGGLATIDDREHHDVMRGEETQLIGTAAAAGHQLIITPGTHSKWAHLQNGTVQRFKTYMTGDLYALLKRHSTLAWSTETAEEGGDTSSFLEGVHDSLEDPDLLHTLFNVRTRALFQKRTAIENASYLSGILIGAEITSGLRLRATESITLIGTSTLAHRYQAALTAAGIDNIDAIDGGTAVARGLWRIWELHK